MHLFLNIICTFTVTLLSARQIPLEEIPGDHQTRIFQRPHTFDVIKNHHNNTKLSSPRSSDSVRYVPKKRSVQTNNTNPVDSNAVAIQDEIAKLRDLMQMLKEQQSTLNSFKSATDQRPKMEDIYYPNSKELVEIRKDLSNLKQLLYKLVSRPDNNPDILQELQGQRRDINNLKLAVKRLLNSAKMEPIVKTDGITINQLQNLEKQLNLLLKQDTDYNLADSLLGQSISNRRFGIAPTPVNDEFKAKESEEPYPSVQARSNAASMGVNSPDLNSFLNLLNLPIDDQQQLPEQSSRDNLMRKSSTSSQLKKLQKQLKKIQKSESASEKSLDDLDDLDDTEDQLRKIKQQLKKLNKESKSLNDDLDLDEDDLTSNLKTLEKAIDGLRPKEEDFDLDLDLDLEEKNIGVNKDKRIQLLLNKLVNKNKNVHISSSVGGAGGGGGGSSKYSNSQIMTLLNKLMNSNGGESYGSSNDDNCDYGDTAAGHGSGGNYGVSGPGGNYGGPTYGGSYGGSGSGGLYGDTGFEGNYGGTGSGGAYFGKGYGGAGNQASSGYGAFGLHSQGGNNYGYGTNSYGPGPGFGYIPNVYGSSNNLYGSNAGSYVNQNANGQSNSYGANLLNYLNGNNNGGNLNYANGKVNGYGNAYGKYFNAALNANGNQHGSNSYSNRFGANTGKNNYPASSGPAYTGSSPNSNYKPSAVSNYESADSGSTSYNPPTSSSNYSPASSDVYNDANIQAGSSYNSNGGTNQPASDYQKQSTDPNYSIHSVFEHLAKDYNHQTQFFPETGQQAAPAASAGQSYPNPPNDYKRQKVQDLKSEIYNLQGVINGINRPEYTQKQEDKETVYKLNRQIGDLKDVINNLSQDGQNYNTQDTPQVEQEVKNPASGGYASSRTDRFERALNEDSQEADEVLDGITSYIDNMLDDSTNNQARIAQSTDDDQTRKLEDVSKKLKSLKNQLGLNNNRNFQARQPHHPSNQYQYYQQHDEPDKSIKGKSTDKKESKKLEVFDKVFTKILEKLIDKAGIAIPKLLEAFLGFGKESLSEYYHDDGYGQGYGYGNDLERTFKSFGLSGYLPMILIKVMTNFGTFINYIRKNPFLKTFMIPAIVLLVVAGAVVFLVWFLQGGCDAGYDGNYNGIGYNSYGGGGDSYGGGQNQYRSNADVNNNNYIVNGNNAANAMATYNYPNGNVNFNNGLDNYNRYNYINKNSR